MKLYNLMPLTWLVAVLVSFSAILTPAFTMTTKIFPDIFYAWLYPNSDAVILVLSGEALATYGLFCVWIYLAGENLRRVGHDDLDFSPSARIWWFLVPFANLVQPYLGMRELWNVSHGKLDREDTSALVAGWWAMWLLGNFGFALFFLFAGGEMPWWADGGLRLVRAGFAIALILGIARAQARLRGPELSQVFA